MDGAVERFAVLGREIKAAGSQDDDKSAAEKFIEEVRKLCRKCGIGSPDCYGIEKEAFLEAVPKMAEDAVASGSPANTRKKIQKEDIIKIYQICKKRFQHKNKCAEAPCLIFTKGYNKT